MNLQTQLPLEELLGGKSSTAENVDCLKRIKAIQNMESSAKAIEANPLSGFQTGSSLRSRSRKYCDFCNMEDILKTIMEKKS